MKKTKRMISLFACLVLMFCLLPAGVSAGSDSKSINVFNLGASFKATATINVTSTSVEGTLSYGTAAQTMSINANISTKDSSGTKTGTRVAATQENVTTYTLLYVSARSDEVFTYAQTYNSLTTLTNGGAIAVSANA